MKKPFVFTKIQLAAAITLLLLFAACFEFDYVNQPGSADPNSSFTVNVSITTNDGVGTESYTPYFGIKLPEGWTVEDNVPFANNTVTGVFEYSASISAEMESIDPADSGYYWWVGAGTEPVIYDYLDTYLIDPVIHTDDQAGTFYLDYMGGSNSQGYGGLNYARHNDNIVTVGLPDEVVVTSTANSGTGSLREAIENVDYYGTITFDLQGENTIVLESVLNIQKDITISGPADEPVTISGGGATQVMHIGQNREPVFEHLVITNGSSGSGGGIYCDFNSAPAFNHVTVSNCYASSNGGGLYLSTSHPTFNHVVIRHNDANSNGGGIYINYDSNPVFSNVVINSNTAYRGAGMYVRNNSYPSLESVTIRENSATYYGGAIYCQYNAHPVFDSLNRSSIFLNNALWGNDIYSDASLAVVVDTFTVLTPDEFFTYPLYNFSFDILHGLIEQVSADVYVSPDGDNSNSGLTTAEPLQTISYALLKVQASDTDPHTIHLMEGTYSPSANGESFPLFMRSNITLAGSSAQDVILDAEGQSKIINFYEVENCDAMNMTLTGGYDANGGAIACQYSSPALKNLVIYGNKATQFGGGIYLSDGCYPELTNVTIANNTAIQQGGGIYSGYYNTITFNATDRCNIYLNNSGFGQDIYSGGNYIDVVVDTFTVLVPNQYHTYPLYNFGFDILNGKVEQVTADLYVSPLGDNANSGLTADEPLKNINFAFSKLIPDTANPVTVHLLEGTYSPSSNNESFPLLMANDVNLDGTGSGETILDAEGLSRLIHFENTDSCTLSNLTLKGGSVSWEYGGAIYCYNSSPLMKDLVITDNQAGYGGGIYCYYNSSPRLQNLVISGNTASDYGGAIFTSYNCDPQIDNCMISDNTAYYGGGIYMEDGSPALSNTLLEGNTAQYYGGGMYCGWNSSPELKHVTVKYNSAQNGGGILFDSQYQAAFDSTERCNIYMNSADYGSDLYSYNNGYPVNIVVDTFTVMYPKFYHAYPLANFNFDILHGIIPQFAADLYVSPDGDNTNTGLTPEEPLKTIRHALIVIAEDSLNLFTIHLAEGTYSPSANGEEFPLTMAEYVYLSGPSDGEAIIDAEQTNRVITIQDIVDIKLSNLTIQGGNVSDGAGIYCYNASPVLENLVIRENYAGDDGGGIFCYNNSSPVLENVLLTNNTSQSSGGALYAGNSTSPVIHNSQMVDNAAYYGGGIWANQSSMELQNVLIAGNEATYSGGGISAESYSSITLNQVTIKENEAETGGGIYNSYSSSIVFDDTDRSNIFFNFAVTGKEIYSTEFMEVVVDTFTVLYPNEFFVFPLENFSFDILNYKYEQINADLYVSPEGDDENGGLSPDDPLKTIYGAFARIVADSLNQNTVYLMEGIYGPSYNGENFPLNVMDWVSIAGLSQHLVILNGEDQSGIMILDGNHGSTISNLTFSHGVADEGGGMRCYNSDPVLSNLTFTHNQAYYGGGGMYIYDAEPEMTNISFTKNKADYGGGLYISSSSSVDLDQALFKMNKAYSGGAVFVDYGTQATFSHLSVENNEANDGGGGGLAISGSTTNLALDHSILANNSAGIGGGIYIYGSADLSLLNSDIYGNQALDYGGGIYSSNNSNVSYDTLYRCNVYLNSAALGNDLYSESFMNVVVDTFSVLTPTKFYVSPMSNYTFDILHGMIAQIDANLYVSPEGNNNNSGLTADAPLKTIYYANSKILAGSSNPHSIHLLPGTYSDSTNGEYFPIMAMDYITLAGSGTEDVILDGEGERRVLDIITSEGVSITDLTITGGYSSNGAGIYISESNPQLSELNIHNNIANSYGGGIYLDDHSNAYIEGVDIFENTAYYGAGVYLSDYSEPVLQDVGIHNNTATYGGGIYFTSNADADLNLVSIHSNQAAYGGGAFITNSDPEMQQVSLKYNTASDYGGGIYLDNYANPDLAHVVLRENTAGYGGGIYLDEGFPLLSRVTVAENTATSYGGGIYFSYYGNVNLDSVERTSIYMNHCLSGQGSDLYCNNNYNPLEALNIVVDTFTVMLPKNHQASPLTSFTFDINFGLIPQEEIELYVSPTGDDNNSGQSQADPMKTIQHAVSATLTDSINLYHVMLMEGTYSPSSNGDGFPIQITDYTALSGLEGSEAILDAEMTDRVLNIQNLRGVELSNLTIQGGSASDGAGIYCNNSDPLLYNLVITDNLASDDGGGIFCYNYSNPVLQNVLLTNNSSQSAGGAIYLSQSTISLNQSVVHGNYAQYDGGGIYLEQSQLDLSGSSINENSSDDGGGIYATYQSTVIYDSLQRPSIYLNEAVRGYDLYTDDMMHVVVDTFSVLYPKSQHAYPLQNYTFDILYGMIPQVQADLYVSPAGDDGNSGLTPDEPLKTINYALSIVAEDSVNLYTVNLLEGTYGPGTSGETFPVYAVDYVNIKGVSADLVTLDGEGLSTVIMIEYATNAKISDLTITGGNGYNGGGITCNFSNSMIENVVFTDNVSTYGGGIYIGDHSTAEIRESTLTNNTADRGGAICITNYSDPLLKDLFVESNTAQHGGGIYVENHSGPTLENVWLSGNTASTDGGGIHCFSQSTPLLKNTRIVGNSSLNEGGGIWCSQNSTVSFDTADRSTIYLNMSLTGNDLYSDNYMMVVVDTFTVMYPKNYHASPLNNFDFDILSGLYPQVNADLYVSPEGDNANSGLTPDDPLRTIHFATSVIAEDSLNMYTIHLANGIYSPSTNGEFFPLFIPEYVSVEGGEMEETILDAEGISRVIAFSYTNEAAVKNLTIKGGENSGGFGGGIYMEYSSASFTNIKVVDCYAKYGGGIFLNNSSPVMTNITVMNNSSFYGGGGICTYDNSNPIIESSMIWDNEASTYGGGMYCSASSSPVMKDISFKYNKASTGAGLYCSNNSNPSLDEAIIINNEAEHSGGGIYAPYANLSIKRSDISGNQCNGKGGGAYLSNFSSSLENTRISENTAVDGGGLYISASAPRIVNCEITLNQATQHGGGIYMSVSEATLINLTIADNACIEGAGIYAYRSEIEVTNSILWNEPLNEVVFRATGTPSSINFFYTDVQGGDNGIISNGNGTVTWVEGNLSEDPLFTGGSIMPYQLTNGSPCVEAGTPDTTGLQLPFCDLLGNVRVWDGDNDGLAVIDMGAYEFDAITGMENLLDQGSTLKVECYPNPFTDVVMFSFETHKAVKLAIEIRDLSGNKVMDLEDGRTIPGMQQLSLNLGALEKGVYFTRFVVGNESVTKKIVKIR